MNLIRIFWLNNSHSPAAASNNKIFTMSRNDFMFGAFIDTIEINARQNELMQLMVYISVWFAMCYQSKFIFIGCLFVCFFQFTVPLIGNWCNCYQSSALVLS